MTSGQAEDRLLVPLHSAASQAGPGPQMEQLLWGMDGGLGASDPFPCCLGPPSCGYQSACLLEPWGHSRGSKGGAAAWGQLLGPGSFTSIKCCRSVHGQDRHAIRAQSVLC